MDIHHFDNDAALQLFLKNRSHQTKESSKESIFNGRKYLKAASLIEHKSRFWKFRHVLVILLLFIPSKCSVKVRKKLNTAIKQYKRGYETTACLYVLKQLDISQTPEKKKNSPIKSTTKPASPMRLEITPTPEKKIHPTVESTSPIRLEEIDPKELTEQTEKIVNLLPPVTQSSDISTYFVESRSVISICKADFEEAKSNWESSALDDEKFLALSKNYKLKHEKYLQSLKETESAYVNFFKDFNLDSEKSYERIEKLLDELNLETQYTRIKHIKRKILENATPEQSHQLLRSKKFINRGLSIVEFLKIIALDEIRFKKFIVAANESDILHYLSEFNFDAPDFIFIHRLVSELIEQNKLISILKRLEPSHLNSIFLRELPLEKLKYFVKLYADKSDMIISYFSMLTEDVELDPDNRLVECYQELIKQAPKYVELAFKTIVHALNRKVTYFETSREQLVGMYDFVYQLNGLAEQHNIRFNEFFQKNAKAFFNCDIYRDESLDNIFLHALAIRSTEELSDEQVKFTTEFSTRSFLFLFLELEDQIKFIDYLYEQMIKKDFDVLKKSYKESFSKIFSMLSNEEIEKLQLNEDLKALLPNS